jgi:hypothetical protein
MPTKFSQIATASSPPASTDTVIGVGGGTTDRQYSISQLSSAVGGFLPAGANLNFYVSTSGSDSNSGTTSGSPFATIQHAVNVAAGYNYQGRYAPTINIAAGTYTISSTINLPELQNLGSAATLQGASETTTIIDGNTNNQSCFQLVGTLSQWNVQLLETYTPQRHYLVFAGAQLRIVGNIHINPPAVDFPSSVYFTVSGGSYIIIQGFGPVVTVTDVNCNGFVCISGNGYNYFQATAVSVVLPTSAMTVGSGWICADGTNSPDGTNGVGQVLWLSTVTNAGSFTAAQINLADAFIDLETTHGDLSSIPGTAARNSYDLGSQISNSDVPAHGIFVGPFKVGRGVPFSPTSLPVADTWAVTHEYNSGSYPPRALVYNDGTSLYLKQIGRNINVQTSNYTMTILDQDGRVEMNSSSSNTFTVPRDSSFTHPVPVGTEVRVTQTGSGATTIAAGGGATVKNAGAIGGQSKSVLLYKTAANTWIQTNV